jgi:hypothetical protein
LFKLSSQVFHELLLNYGIVFESGQCFQSHVHDVSRQRFRRLVNFHLEMQNKLIVCCLFLNNIDSSEAALELKSCDLVVASKESFLKQTCSHDWSITFHDVHHLFRRQFDNCSSLRLGTVLHLYVEPLVRSITCIYLENAFASYTFNIRDSHFDLVDIEMVK